MFKNKIYNYITLELIKSFILILFSLSLIAWTVRAVNFLDLIVDSGYSTSTYFIYSILRVCKYIIHLHLLTLMLCLSKYNTCGSKSLYDTLRVVQTIRGIYYKVYFKKRSKTYYLGHKDTES